MTTFSEFLNRTVAKPDDFLFRHAKRPSPGMVVHRDFTQLSKEKPQPIHLKNAIKPPPLETPVLRDRKDTWDTNFKNRFKPRQGDFGSPTRLT